MVYRGLVRLAPLRSTPALATCVVLAALAAGCAPSGHDLGVLVTTDLRAAPGPHAEFDAVHVTVAREGADPVVIDASASATSWPSLRATRVASFSGLASGEYVVTVSLSLGVTAVGSQSRRVRIVRDYALSLLLDRRCLDAPDRCSGTTSTCVLGDCVPLPCLDDPTLVECESECLFADDCEGVIAPVACASVTCEVGRCVPVPNDSRCESGTSCDIVDGDPAEGGCIPAECEGPLEDLYLDRDGDGLGGEPQRRCPGPGLVRVGGDCDDTRADIGRCEADAGIDGGVPCTDDEACDDGLSCNGSETCDEGECRPGVFGCDDGIACTRDTCTPSGCAWTADDDACRAVEGGRCDVAMGGCQYDVCDTATTCVPADGCELTLCRGTRCIRESACGADQTCCNGACVAAGCDDGQPCTLDSCNVDPDVAPLGCVHLSGSTCEDGNLCTTGESCGATMTCGGGRPIDCDDGNPCTVDTCGAAVGCVHEAVLLYDDGDECTIGEDCLGTVLVPGTPATCDDGVGCTTDVCTTGAGCSHTPDDDACTAVAGGICDGEDGCQYPGACTAATCSPASACETARCLSDRTTCSRDPVCAAGVLCCGGTCCPDDGDPCTDEVCSGTSCTHPFNTAVCDDEDACTVSDRCAAGTCAGTPMTCAGSTDCVAQVCTGGTCSPMARPDGTTCSDGNACTSGDACASGACVPGAPLVCDDGEDCTTDSCVAGSGCSFVPVALMTFCGPGMDLEACLNYRCVPGTGECRGTPICSGGLTCCTASGMRCGEPGC